MGLLPVVVATIERTWAALLVGRAEVAETLPRFRQATAAAGDGSLGVEYDLRSGPTLGRVSRVSRVMGRL